MKGVCYACDGVAVGYRDRRPEKMGVVLACERHAERGFEPSLYEACKAAGFRLDSHESDLYVEASAASLELLTERGVKFSAFTDTEGRCWYDVPFVFDPWWADRERECSVCGPGHRGEDGRCKRHGKRVVS